jgi:hypothetical protein
VPAPAGADKCIRADMAESGQLRRGPQDDVPAPPAVAAVRAAARHIFLPPEADTASSAIAGSGRESQLIQEVAQTANLPDNSLMGHFQ